MILDAYTEAVSASTWQQILEDIGRAARRDRLPKYFGASSFTSCLKKTGYGMSGMEPPDPIYHLEWDMAKAIGSGMHDRIEEILKSADEDAPFELVGTELWCAREPLLFGGFIDAVIRLREPIPALELSAGLCILEFKSIESKYLAKGYRWYENKVASFFAQAQAYMHIYDVANETIRQALVTVTNRDTPKDTRVYRLRHNAHFMNDHIEDRLIPAALARKEEELPRAEPSRDCKLCGYRNICPESEGKDT